MVALSYDRRGYALKAMSLYCPTKSLQQLVIVVRCSGGSRGSEDSTELISVVRALAASYSDS